MTSCGRFAMHQRPGDASRHPTVFATQSTHKLLAAFSQASMIHIRSSPRAPVDRSRFNEAYMMHASTSPLYQLIASCDVAGAVADQGIPAQIVTQFLDERGIEVEKTGDYVILLLFSMGVTRGKWGTLLDALLDFKELYDHGAPLQEAIPRLVAEHPRHYAGLSLRDLCDQLHAAMRAHQVGRLLDQAFGTLPVPVLPPGRAYQLLVRDQVEWVAVDEMGGRVAAVMVVPYPPGIPLLMPGEHAGPPDGPVLGYLTALQDLDRGFPGFSHDIHGVQPAADGTYRVMCIKDGFLPFGFRRRTSYPAPAAYEVAAKPAGS